MAYIIQAKEFHGIEDWQILEQRPVYNMNNGNWLVWWLVADETELGSTWHPFVVGPDKRTILEAPAWAPLPGAQYLSMQCPIFEVLLEGNRGSGKSELLLMDYAKDVDKGYGENWRGILFRKQLGDLDEMVRKAEQLFSKLYGKRFRFLYSKADYKCTWDTGEALLFRHLENIEDYQEYHGHQYPWIGYEELTQWEDDKPYRKMFSCCRPTAQGVPVRVRANTNPYGCVPYGEVLTADRGWADIREIAPGDSVVSAAQDGTSGIAKVSAVTHAPFEGDLCLREGAGLSMAFTPTHRFPHFNTDRSAFEVKQFDQLPGEAVIKRTAEWRAPELVAFSVHLQPTRKRRLAAVTTLCGLDYAALMGWFLSEGCVVDRDRAFAISQMKIPQRENIRRLLDRCGFKASWSDQGATVYSCDWYEYLKQFGKCRDKFVPREILESGPETLAAFFNAAMAGDGCNGIYYTTSKRLADDMAEIAVKLGLGVYTSERQRPNRRGLSYQVCTSERRSITLHTGNHVYDVATHSRQGNVKRVPFSGTVYCITVPETETFFIRQDGCVWLSGNTGHHWVKKRFQLPKMRGRVIRIPGEEPRVAINLDLRENFVLLHTDPGYPNRIRAAAGSKAESDAWAGGDWNVNAGGMFDDVWEPQWNLIADIKPTTIPRGWRFSRSYDHGQSHPFAYFAWAESNGEAVRIPVYDVLGKLLGHRNVGTVRGDIVLIKEWYGCKEGEDDVGIRMLSTDIAQGIKDRETDWGISWRMNSGPADANIWTKDPRGLQTAVIDDFEAVLGIDCFEKADMAGGSRKIGYQKIREYMKGAHPGPQGIREKPGLFVCESNTHWLDLVPTAPRNPDDMDELPDKYEDHPVDATRYRLTWAHSIMGQGRF